MNNEFKEIEDLLDKADVGSDRYKQTIFNKLKFKMETGTLKTNNNLENDFVNKRKFFKPAKVATLALGVVLVGTGAAYGSQVISSIIERFIVGDTEIVQYDMDKLEDFSFNEMSLEAIQEGFKGKLFDKDGNEVLYGEHQEYYNKDGELITTFGTKSSTDGNDEIEFFAYTDNDSDIDRVFTLNEIKNSASENIKFPTYLPEGYDFKEGLSKFNGNSIELTYGNDSGESITINISTSREATNGVVTIEEVIEKNINGKNVVLTGNAAFWESEGVTYQLYLNSDKDENNSIDIEELSKMIKSMK